MRVRILTVAVGLCGAAASAFAGPDLICSEINGAILFGNDGNGTNSYAFGTVVCNIGDEQVGWNPDTNEHPLFSQTLYKLKDHQITQIGIGFVRHATTPLAGNACGLGCTPVGSLALGVGCSDTSSALISGSQGFMGPRTEVDAQSGFYPYPFTSINQTGDAVYKRLQVSQSDISDPDALYFVETQVISSVETTGESRDNNMSYRQVQFQAGSLNPVLIGPTYAEQAAIYAWRDHGNGVGVPDPTVMISEGSISGDGERLIVASQATNLGTDAWRYNYAILNMNGHRGVRRLGVGLGEPDAVVQSTSFSAPSYHDDLDQQILNTPWSTSVLSGVEWSTDSFQTDPFANAIRWGTMYSFSFDVENQFGPSVGESVSVGLFGPDDEDLQHGFEAWAPPYKECFFCLADLNGDGFCDVFDIAEFVSTQLDYNRDTVFDFFDIAAFIADYNISCYY